MECLDTRRRAATLAELAHDSFDVVIIGGGITGAATAFEAASRGLRVALLEAEDFASGTSSRSSKLIHGGLRYLALGDVALVRETALERKVVHAIAPHLAQPRWMVLPVRSRAGLLKFRTAITTYEKLGAVEQNDLHRNWDSDDLEREEPALDRAAFPYACAYREYLTDDARLVMANLRAAVGQGAVCLNWLSAQEIERSAGGKAVAVRARCALSGETVRIAARVVVNAAGPWVEAVRRMEEPDAPSVLALSKGVHLCFSRTKLPVRNLVLINAADRRTLFAIPRGEVTYVGTTDTPYDGPATVWPPIERDDVDYVLAPLHRHFPDAAVKEGDVVASWAGLRPLLAEPGKKVQDLSRRDEVTVGEGGVVSVAGGKLTGFRPMALRVVDVVLEQLGDFVAKEAAAEPAPLPGGDFGGDCAHLVGRLRTSEQVDDAIARRFVRLYGSDSSDVLALGRDELASSAPIRSGEIEWAVCREGAARIEDVLFRRARVALYEPQSQNRLIAPVAARMAELLGWGAEQRAAEEQRVCDLLARDRWGALT